MLQPYPPRSGIVSHGTVAPAQTMPLAAYDQALANTQDLWIIDETRVGALDTGTFHNNPHYENMRDY